MKLKNSLVVLDVESTGVWVEKDKVIEVAFIKYSPEGKREVLHSRVNPGMAIPPVITELTGISDADVKDAPFFKDIALRMLDFMGFADLGGFNIEKFDLPLLEREFFEAGHKFEWQLRKIYDAQKVYHLNEKRDLTAAYQFYCAKELVGAHSALADSEAVYEILEKQVVKYGEGAEELAALDKFEYRDRSKYHDSEGKFCWWDGKLYPTFGKYRRKMPLDEIVKKDTDYLNWILKSDFKEDVKDLIRAALKGVMPKYEEKR